MKERLDYISFTVAAIFWFACVPGAKVNPQFCQTCASGSVIYPEIFAGVQKILKTSIRNRRCEVLLSNDIWYPQDSIICLPKARASYFISNGGNDNQSGTHPHHAWQTIGKLNGFGFVSGDSIFFKAGDIWRSQFVVPSDSLAIGRYGKGENPTFAAELVAGKWINEGGGIWSIPCKIHGYGIVFEDEIPVQPKASSLALTDGKWYPVSDKRLYYRPSSGDPVDHQVSFSRIASHYLSGIDVSGRKNISIAGINFHSLPVGIVSKGDTKNITVIDCDFRYCQSGVMLMPDRLNENAIIQDNFFYRCHNATRMYTVGSNTGEMLSHGINQGCKIINNEFDQGGYISDQREKWNYGFSDYEAIGLQNFSEGEIAENHIHDGFQIGLIFYNLYDLESNDNDIHHNRILNNSKAAFHTAGHDQDDAALFGYSGNHFHHNLIIDCDDGLESANMWYKPGKANKYMNYIVHNTCLGPNCFLEIDRSEIPSFVTVKNNIFESHQGKNTAIYGNGPVTQVRISHNIFKPLAQLKLDKTFRPMKNSPIIDAGEKMDYNYVGLAPDCGAFEFVEKDKTEQPK